MIPDPAAGSRTATRARIAAGEVWGAGPGAARGPWTGLGESPPPHPVSFRARMDLQAFALAFRRAATGRGGSMEKHVMALMVAGLLAAGPALSGDTKTEEPVLKAGDPAPAFSLPGSDGKTYSLDQFKGEKAVVIAWFPKAFTGG